jgi:hypothetical protein
MLHEMDPADFNVCLPKRGVGRPGAEFKYLMLLTTFKVFRQVHPEWSVPRIAREIHKRFPEQAFRTVDTTVRRIWDQLKKGSS